MTMTFPNYGYPVVRRKRTLSVHDVELVCWILISGIIIPLHPPQNVQNREEVNVS